MNKPNPAGVRMFINLGSWTRDQLDIILRKAFEIKDFGDRTAFLSGLFMDLPYRESTLLVGAACEEVLTIDLSGVDCFTLIDYIEAMRRSYSYGSFLENLRRVRYKDGIVSYGTRNHFFTDWAEYSEGSVRDVTGEIAGGKTVAVAKSLNLRDDGTSFVPGVPPCHRTVNYIPSEHIHAAVLQRLRTGDYAGIYSPLAGLDVSHVGIIIKTRDNILFRHASSENKTRKVVDQDLTTYLMNKQGLVILRAFSQNS